MIDIVKNKLFGKDAIGCTNVKLYKDEGKVVALEDVANHLNNLVKKIRTGKLRQITVADIEAK